MFMGLPNFCIRFRKDMILSDGVISVASRTRFGSAQNGSGRERGATTGVPIGTTEQIQGYIQIFTLILYSVSYHMSV